MPVLSYSEIALVVETVVAWELCRTPPVTESSGNKVPSVFPSRPLAAETVTPWTLVSRSVHVEMEQQRRTIIIG